MSDLRVRMQEYILVSERAARPWVGGLWLSWMFFLGVAVVWGKVTPTWAAVLFPLVTLFIGILGARVPRIWHRELEKYERLVGGLSGPSSGLTSGDQGVSRN